LTVSFLVASDNFDDVVDNETAAWDAAGSRIPRQIAAGHSDSMTGLRSNVELQVAECQNVEKSMTMSTFCPYLDSPRKVLDSLVVWDKCILT
jgi:hypothetical protein